MKHHILPTGQSFCADERGNPIACAESGQDGEHYEKPTESRFEEHGQTVLDTLTGLTWLTNANAAEFPLAWDETLEFIERMNAEETAGHADWRLPNRRELFSLISFDTHSPALPPDHPFDNVFHGWYRTSTPSAMHPEQIWHVHLGGGRMFWGSRSGYEMVWPVCGTSDMLPAITSGDAEHAVTWPEPRFEADGETVRDRLTGLHWTRSADLSDGPVAWSEAFACVARLNAEAHAGIATWRLPSIREFESLTDAAHYSPALCPDHPFADTREAYWSATNSAFEHDWAMCHYLHKGAAGVGFKQDAGFHVWAVTETP